MLQGRNELPGVTYAMSDTDLAHISSFTAHASRLYSISGFLLGLLLNTFLNYGNSAAPLSDTANFLLHRGAILLGVGAVGFFLWGYSVTRSKEDVIDHIRRECGVFKRVGIPTLIYEHFRRRVEKRFAPEPQSPESTTHEN